MRDRDDVPGWACLGLLVLAAAVPLGVFMPPHTGALPAAAVAALVLLYGAVRWRAG